MKSAPLKFVAVAGATALNAVTAFACPLCHSPTGEKVREGIFNSEFPMTFFSMVMPFVVIAGVVAVIHHSSPRIAEPRSEADPTLRPESKAHDYGQ